jgi:hypothetical protein
VNRPRHGGQFVGSEHDVITHHLLRRLAAGVVAIGCIIGTAHAADVQFPVGSSLGLVPPAGLHLDGTFPGFRDADNGVSMMLLELPPPAYESIRGSLSTQEAKQRGVLVDVRETMFTDAGAALVSAGEETKAHQRMWMMLAQMPRFTALVTVQIPDKAKALYPDAAIQASLKTLALRPPPIDEQLGLLPFRLTDLGGFRVVAIVNRNAVVLTKGARDTIHALDQPHIVIGIGTSGSATQREWPRVAEVAFESFPGFVERKITAAEMIKVDGMPAYEIRAEAKDAVTGAPLVIVQWLRFGAGSFVQIIGITSKENWSRDFPQFRAVRDGIQPKKS